MGKLFSLLLAGMMVLASVDAEAAKRLGGGRSVGQQSNNVTQREAAKPAPAPAQQQAQPAAAQPSPATAANPAAAQRKPWGAMLGGLAAGLGLAWLAHSLGFGEVFANIMLFALLALVVMVVIGMVMRARRGGAAGSSPYAMQGAGAGTAPGQAPVMREYNPDKVGNDASARPWERDSTGGIRIGSALGGAQPKYSWNIPADFDSAGFVEAAKRNFVTLQAAWDRADLATLRSMMTDGMLAEIRTQLAEREQHTGGPANQTDVVMLDAKLLGIEDLGDGYMASVEFSGMIREEPSAGPSPFREVWNMTKPKAGNSGWLVAGVQALQ